MKFPRVHRILAALLLSILLLTTACAQQAPSRFDQVQQESSQQKRGQAVARDATQGSEFNKFFPSASDGYQRVFTQEKKGFAQAKLKRDGKDVALMSINDTTSNPSAAAKFANSPKQISGYPAVELGKQTAVLVDNRYQVKVISSDSAFSASDREAWLKKFNLSGLARVKA
jgi:Tfp pilus assembly protein PilV